MANFTRIQANDSLCRDCQSCALACSLYHEAECSLDLSRVLITKDMVHYEFQIVLCQHCEAPECAQACAAGALTVDRRGVVMIDDSACTRCGACASSCPYGAIFYSESADRYLKCDLCAGRESGPVCVQVCPVDAVALVGRDSSGSDPA